MSSCGINAILSVNEGEMCYPAEFRMVGIEYCCVPLSKNIPPVLTDTELCVERLPVALDFMRKCLRDQKTVLIHCFSGKDRTCLLMSYYLMCEHQKTPEQAMKIVKSVRETAFSAEGWGLFVKRVLQACKQTC